MKILSLTVGVLLLGIVGWTNAADCNCPARLSPADELAASSTVMEAYVVAVGSTTGESTAYSVAVNKVWKGSPMATATIHTLGAGTSCSVTLEIGKNYLIYAKGENLETGFCSRTFDEATHVGRLDYQEDLSAFKNSTAQ